MVRTTLNIDPAILTAAKEVAAETHRSLGSVISEWAARGLQACSHGPSTGKKRRTKPLFPVFGVPADAPPITSQRVKKLLNGELV